MQQSIRHDVSLLTEDDLYLFNEGRHYQAYTKLGAHPHQADGVAGTYFATWAPNAHLVSLVGNFNRWQPGAHPLVPRGHSGIWEGFVAGLGKGEIYKFHVESRHRAYRADKADPYGFWHEVPPQSGSVVWDLDYQWSDREWMARRRARNRLDAPISVYEVHLGSWRRNVEEDRPLTYRELAEPLAEHVTALGFSHVELMPVMEHPFGGSWGYQVTGYFAPTSRFGTPQDFMQLVDHLHGRGIGVILDWVPSHFPTDEHGLGYFDGTHLYEHADPRQGFHPDWGSWIFNYGRNEVRSFLLSNALFWLDVYHVDGLRIDAVASALYLDYSRKEGEWVPNKFGGRENLEAIAFFQQFNQDVYGSHEGVQTIAEESTSWPGVSRPTHLGGLGFGLKWDMGWMHDTLHYMQRDPIHRVYHHNNLTFRMLYAFTENFVLALSHDEVVHGKGSLLNKMPGDVWQKMANLRLLYGYMYSQPGKKLLFMGGEIGQWSEWNHESSLEWHLLDDASHRGIAGWIADLNRVYREEPALYELDCDPHGFEWIDANDATSSVISFLRRGRSTDDLILAIANFTPVPREHYRLGVPRGGWWRELLNSDAGAYGGSNVGNGGGVPAEAIVAHGRPCSVELVLPPLAIVFLKSEAPASAPPVPD